MLLGQQHFLVIGQPLLDIVVEDHVHHFLAKYQLSPDNAILAQPNHLSLFKEVEADSTAQHSPGGAALNTARMLQWLLDEPERVVFFGGIGADRNGQILSSECRKLRLKTLFKVSPDKMTGKCAVIVQNENRSMVTHLGASQYFATCLDNEMRAFVNGAKVFYITAYFITTCVEFIHHVVHEVEKSADNLLTFNLSAPFLQTAFHKQIDSILPHVDILFGNMVEAREFAKVHDLEATAAAVCGYFCRLSRPPGKRDKPRLVILTDGSKPVIYQVSGHAMETFEISPAPRVVDSNGAGDAFVAGFLFAFAKHGHIRAAIEMGAKTARHVLGFRGFQMGDRPDFVL